MSLSPTEFVPREGSRSRPVQERNPALDTPMPHALLTPREVAELLRTSRKGVYAMVERRQLPGVTRLGRRVLFRADVLLHWLRQKSTLSSER